MLITRTQYDCTHMHIPGEVEVASVGKWWMECHSGPPFQFHPDVNVGTLREHKHNKVFAGKLEEENHLRFTLLNPISIWWLTRCHLHM